MCCGVHPAAPVHCFLEQLRRLLNVSQFVCCANKEVSLSFKVAESGVTEWDWKFIFCGVFVVCGSEILKAPDARENSQELTSGWQLLLISEHRWELKQKMSNQWWWCGIHPEYQPKESAVLQAQTESESKSLRCVLMCHLRMWETSYLSNKNVTLSVLDKQTTRFVLTVWGKVLTIFEKSQCKVNERKWSVR